MRIHFWNFVLSLFYAGLVCSGIYWLTMTGRLYADVPIMALVLMTLAIFRLVRLFCYDIITKFIRDWFAGAKKNSLNHTISELLNCPWCTGLWFSFIIVFFYFATPYAWPLILILGLGAAASFLQVFANLIGWHAEGKKRQVQDML
jgi:hypothetical protein